MRGTRWKKIRSQLISFLIQQKGELAVASQSYAGRNFCFCYYGY